MNTVLIELLAELIELMEVFVVVLVVVFLLGVADEGGHAGVVGGGTVAVVVHAGVGYADTATAAVLIVVVLLSANSVAGGPGGVTDDGTHIDFLIRRGNWFFVRSGKFILLLLST